MTNDEAYDLVMAAAAGEMDGVPVIAERLGPQDKCEGPMRKAHRESAARSATSGIERVLTKRR